MGHIEHRKRLFFFAICTLFTSCMGNDGLRTEAMSNNNIWGISRIYEGMSEREVARYMGKPFEYNSFWAGEDFYDIWFYVTQPTVLGQSRMVKQNLTPLIFKNGILLGWGYHFYEKALYAQKKEIQTKPEPKAPIEGEDYDLEKNLQSSQNQPPGRSPKADEPSNLKIKSWEPKNPNAKKAPPPEPPKSPPPEKTDPPDNQDKAFDKQGNRLLEDESEQDFNFW